MGASEEQDLPKMNFARFKKIVIVKCDSKSKGDNYAQTIKPVIISCVKSLDNQVSIILTMQKVLIKQFSNFNY